MNAKEWAAKVDRAATDPESIERRKAIKPALAVERTVTYLPERVLEAMENDVAQRIPASHAAIAKALRAKFLGQ